MTDRPIGRLRTVVATGATANGASRILNGTR